MWESYSFLNRLSTVPSISRHNFTVSSISIWGLKTRAATNKHELFRGPLLEVGALLNFPYWGYLASIFCIDSFSVFFALLYWCFFFLVAL